MNRTESFYNTCILNDYYHNDGIDLSDLASYRNFKEPLVQWAKDNPARITRDDQGNIVAIDGHEAYRSPNSLFFSFQRLTNT